jgi:hypothetical protein
MGKILLENVGLGEQAGEARLKNGDDFQSNRGSAAIDFSETGQGGFKIQVCRLDDFIEEGKAVGVCKIDVEGHELSVLKGARRLLRQKAIRDIIFEDFNPQPSAVTRLLADHDYEIFHLESHLFKPKLMPLEASSQRGREFSYNFLATLNPERARKRFRPAGWRCLLNF